MPDALLTAAQAAERLGVSPSRIRQLILAGRLKAAKFAGVHMIRESELAAVIIHPRGRPRRPPG